MLMDILAALSEPAAANSQTDSAYRDASPAMLPIPPPHQPPSLSARSVESDHDVARSPATGSRPSAPRASAAAAPAAVAAPSSPPSPPPPDWRLLDVQAYKPQIHRLLHICGSIFRFTDDLVVELGRSV